MLNTNLLSNHHQLATQKSCEGRTVMLSAVWLKL